jgi:hypothetical protein
MLTVDEILERVDRLSDVLVHVHCSDTKTLADLSRWFTKLSRLASATAQWEMAIVTEAVARVLEKMRITSAMQESLMYLPGSPRAGGLSGQQTSATDLKTDIRESIMTELCSLRYVSTGNKAGQAVLVDPKLAKMWAQPLRTRGNPARCVIWGFG